MKYRALGTSGLNVSAEGLGCAGMSAYYGQTDEPESVATILRALDMGVNFLDTAETYGHGANEELIGRAIAGRREDVVLATKYGGSVIDGKFVMTRPDQIRNSCDASLRRLGTDYVDLYYGHRIDSTVPIEESVGAVAELVAAGKVRHIGLCEASATTIRRAAKVSPIAAVQCEWSLWTRDAEAEVLPAARESGVGIVAYSPLGRGFLTGKFSSSEEFADGDIRQAMPRFQRENLANNQKIIDQMREMAAEKECTIGQLALAWVLSQGEDVVPIPGTKRRPYLEENIAAVGVQLDADDQAKLAEAASGVVGDRYGSGPTGSPTYGETPLPA